MSTYWSWLLCTKFKNTSNVCSVFITSGINLEYNLLLIDETMTGKHSQASENSPSNKEKNRSKSSHTVPCCIYEADIVDECAGISLNVLALASRYLLSLVSLTIHTYACIVWCLITRKKLLL